MTTQNSQAPSTGAVPSPSQSPESIEKKPISTPDSKSTPPAKDADKSSADVQDEKFTIKVNGKQKQVDKKTLLAYVQRQLAADEKFRTASQKQKSIQTLARMARQDPDRLLRQLTGQDPVEIYKKRISDEIKKMNLTPEQRQLEQAKAKLAEYEKKQLERQKKAQEQTANKAKQFYVKKYDNQIPVALKQAGLPVNQDTVRYTAQVMLANLEQGLDLPYEIVMELVKDKYQSSVKGYLSAAQKEKLIDLLGQDTAAQIVQLYQKRKGKKPAQVAKQAIQDGSVSETQPKMMSREQFQEYVKSWSKR